MADPYQQAAEALAHELRERIEELVVGGGTDPWGNGLKDAVLDAICDAKLFARLEQAERERDEARQEIERLDSDNMKLAALLADVDGESRDS